MRRKSRRRSPRSAWTRWVEKTTTVFPRADGGPFLYDYQIKGFFKDACGSLARVPGTHSNKLKAYKKVIDGTIFVGPRQIPLLLKGELGNCQRPCRPEMLGVAIFLANSETAPAGTEIEFEITTLDPAMEKVVTEWLDYGRLRGMGQWRNSGKGRFTWQKVG